MNENPIQNLEKLETQDLKVVPINVGETLIFLQRHADYDRQTGKLTELGAFAARNQSERQLKEIFESVPEGERKDICVMVVASPTVKNEAREVWRLHKRFCQPFAKHLKQIILVIK